MEKLRGIYASIKAWDEKHTNMHSGIYMIIFLTAAYSFLLNISHASAGLM